MEKLKENASTLERKGMNWIDSELSWVSKTWQLPFRAKHWECVENSGERAFSLIVEGLNKRRAMKVFSKSELQDCQTDTKLQGDLQMRLLRMLNFVAEQKDKRTNDLFSGK